MGRWMRLAVYAACFAFAPAARAEPQAPPGAADDAQEKEAAKEWARKGRARFDQGDYAGAVEALREAERHFPAATILKLRADAHAALGQLLAARKAYELAAAPLPEGASPQLVAAQEAAKAALAGLDARIPTLEITVRGGAAGAAVKLDGAALPAADLARPVAVDPGKHTLAVEAPGAEARIREVQVAEGARERVVLEAGAPNVDRGNPEPAAEQGRSWVGPGIAFGVGGAGLVLGAVTGLLTVAKMDDVRATCGEALVCPEGYRGDVDGAKTLGHVSTAGFIAAGVGAAAGVILLVLPGKKAPAGVGLAVGPAFTGVKGVF